MRPMKHLRHVGLLAILLLVGCRAVADRPARTGPASPAAPQVAPAALDSVALSREEHVEEVLRSIAGREEEPAGEVFENVQLLKGVPAGRLLRIMDMGFGRSLGVGCAHCHDPSDWASDDKRPKRAAREMFEMVQTINTELLAGLEELDSERPTVNCTTCHRGAVEPALQMP